MPQFNELPMVSNSKPYVRWWWFSGPLDYQEIATQLNWIAKNGFGGVEIAWVYPYTKIDASEGPEFLDSEFQSYVQFTIEQCKLRNLGCDLTFGTLWPFSGTFIPDEFASKTYEGMSNQRVNRSWEARYAKSEAKILDHLDKQAFAWYSAFLMEHGFKSFSTIQPLSFFCDSWEVEPRKLSYRTFTADFEKKYGYTYNFLTRDPDQRFDYRQLISERILTDFYEPYAQHCKESGAFSRIQCHGAPTDILAAYAKADIPESETLLFNPKFASFAASAAALWKKNIVSSESFTCLYGWVPSPATPPHIKEEQIDDLRCIADAQFAWGINRIVWHGMPYSTTKEPKQFYATTHVGPDSGFAEQLPQFNAYLEEISGILSKGETISSLCILLPLEDQWMLDRLPKNLEKPSSIYWWELQELSIPQPLMQYRPLWFSAEWLNDLSYKENRLLYKDNPIGALYCMSEYMCFSSLEKLSTLCTLGAPIYFSRLPKEPGTKKHASYQNCLSLISAFVPSQTTELKPILRSKTPLDYWCKKDGNIYHLFISHPQMRNLRYPLPHGFAKSVLPQKVQATFYAQNKPYELHLEFPKGSSLLIEINNRLQKVTIRKFN